MRRLFGALALSAAFISAGLAMAAETPAGSAPSSPTAPTASKAKATKAAKAKLFKPVKATKSKKSGHVAPSASPPKP